MRQGQQEFTTARWRRLRVICGGVSDAFRIQCDNGEHLEIVFAMDCHDREVMSWACSTRGIDGGLVRDLMVDCVDSRFWWATAAQGAVVIG